MPTPRPTGLLPWSCHPPPGARRLTPTGPTSPTSDPSEMQADRGRGQGCLSCSDLAPSRSSPSLTAFSFFTASSHTCIPRDSSTSTWPRYLVGKGREDTKHSHQCFPMFTGLQCPIRQCPKHIVCINSLPCISDLQGGELHSPPRYTSEKTEAQLALVILTLPLSLGVCVCVCVCNIIAL